jgi:signal peptidase I
MNVLLDTDDVKRVAGPGTIVLTYNKLKHVGSIENLFSDGVKNVIILYRKSRNVGHWVGLIKRGDTVEYFDSYGYDIDKPLSWAGFNENNAELGQDYPILTHLLYDYLNENPNHKVVYNEYKYQGLDDKNSSTCGRHVSLRIRNRDLSLEQYQKFFNKMKKQQIDPDQYVVTATNKYLS